jgi:hypothetical protein
LSDPSLTKADQKLQQALETAREEEEITVVVTFGDVGEAAAEIQFGADQGMRPRGRAEMRQRAIQQLQGSTVAANTATINTLRSQELKIQGNGLVGSVVINGTARQIRSGLSIDRVTHASLDETFELVRPVKT